MDEDELWSQIDTQRTAIVGVLCDLEPAEWTTPTLCPGWSVRDLAGHLTMPGMSARGLLGLAFRHLGGTNRIIREGAREIARKAEPSELTRRIAATVGNHRPMIGPGLTSRDMLIDVLAHGFDLTIPLGREFEPEPDLLAEASDRFLTYGNGRNSKVFRRLPFAGLSLAATDHEWSHGSGPEVAGEMADLFLMLTGRTARLDRLTGPGAQRLRDAALGGGITRRSR